MKALLILGAIVAELSLVVITLGNLVYGITETYTIVAAGHNRVPYIGAVIAIFFLWIFAWLPAILSIGGMFILFAVWRDADLTRWQKVKNTAGIVVMVLIVPCGMQLMSGFPMWIVGEAQCKANLRDVLTWTWPCR